MDDIIRFADTRSIDLTIADSNASEKRMKRKTNKNAKSNLYMYYSTKRIREEEEADDCLEDRVQGAYDKVFCFFSSPSSLLSRTALNRESKKNNKNARVSRFYSIKFFVPALCSFYRKSFCVVQNVLDVLDVYINLC